MLNNKPNETKKERKIAGSKLSKPVLSFDNFSDADHERKLPMKVDTQFAWSGPEPAGRLQESRWMSADFRPSGQIE